MKSSQVTSFQLIFILSGTQIGTGIISLYREVFEAGAGPDAWISILVAGGVAQLAILLLVHLASRFPNESLVEYSKKLLGPIGWLLLLIVFTFFVTIAGIVSRNFATVLNIWELPKTPIVVLILATLLPTLYIISNGLKVFARFSFVAYLLTWWLIVITIFAFSKGDVLNILPIGQSGLKGILSGVIAASFSMIGLELILLLYPFVDRKRDVLIAATIGNALTTSAYLLVVFSSAFFFSPADVPNLLWPSLQLLKLVKFSFVQRIETIALSLWLLQVIITVSGYLWGASYTLYRTLGLNSFKPCVVIAGILALIAALIPGDYLHTIFAMRIIGNIGLGFEIVLPAFLLVIYYLKRWLVDEK